MTVQSLCLGTVMTNVYFLMNEDTKEMLIVDPAVNTKRICAQVDVMQGKPVAVLLTHGHFDHIMATKDIAEKYNIPIVAARAEEELLGDPRLNLSIISGMGQVSVKPDILVDDNDEPEISEFKFRVLLTPGHTSGSCCYYFYEDKILISGDTLFYGSCGRTDFPTSSAAEMGRSLKRLVTELPEDVKVYPGHDCETSIGFEKRMNPFV
ncbi:MAG TPA: MBL fold metallo-hydrolase [Candidatus Alectryocaccobium stercorigallinarum]|nr:MBL fold metallo-hydrolase [Candidatus Alectryocaccobium stercorigallinarum]